MPARNDYERVLAVVQATEDNTTLQIDFNGDGVFDSFNTENGYRTARADPVDAHHADPAEGPGVRARSRQRRRAAAPAGQGRGHPGGQDAPGRVLLRPGRFELRHPRRVGLSARVLDATSTTRPPTAATGVCTGVCNTDVLLYNPNATRPSPSTGRPRRAAGASPWPPTRPRSSRPRPGSYVPERLRRLPERHGRLLGHVRHRHRTETTGTGATAWCRATCSPTSRPWPGRPGNSPPLACNAANAPRQRLVPHARPRQHHLLHRRQRRRHAGHRRQHRGPPWRDRGRPPPAPATRPTGSSRSTSRGATRARCAGSLCDLTGARIYATGPFSMSYGENPDRTTAAGGLDLGYTVSAESRQLDGPGPDRRQGHEPRAGLHASPEPPP